MDIWTHMHFTAMGLKIAVAIIGVGLSFKWLRVRNGRIEISPERLRLIKKFSVGLLWVLAVGFILEIWYEYHLLQISQ